MDLYEVFITDTSYGKGAVLYTGHSMDVAETKAYDSFREAWCEIDVAVYNVTKQAFVILMWSDASARKLGLRRS